MLAEGRPDASKIIGGNKTTTFVSSTGLQQRRRPRRNWTIRCSRSITIAWILERYGIRRAQ